MFTFAVYKGILPTLTGTLPYREGDEEGNPYITSTMQGERQNVLLAPIAE